MFEILRKVYMLVCRRNRYTAYRQLVRWRYEYLGKDVRIVLPCCAVKRIRLAFQSAAYTGYQPAPARALAPLLDSESDD